mmetsp:Transcript_32531/g.54961  ORF Transcript_32531/g.54961 Transcript_32531/m.54961 type:complete len:204 (+) Transcript_32531:1381-1992(+)
MVLHQRFHCQVLLLPWVVELVVVERMIYPPSQFYPRMARIKRVCLKGLMSNSPEEEERRVASLERRPHCLPHRAGNAWLPIYRDRRMMIIMIIHRRDIIMLLHHLLIIIRTMIHRLITVRRDIIQMMLTMLILIIIIRTLLLHIIHVVVEVVAVVGTMQDIIIIMVLLLHHQEEDTIMIVTHMTSLHLHRLPITTVSIYTEAN